MIATLASLSLLVGACSDDADDAAPTSTDGTAPPDTSAPTRTTPDTTPLPDDFVLVGDAVQNGLEGQVTLVGFLHVQDGTARLCSAVLDSYPPQCGGDTVTVEGLDADDLALLTAGPEPDGPHWMDAAMLTGNLEDGTLHAAALVPFATAVS